jgi:hypothetical protein
MPTEAIDGLPAHTAAARPCAYSRSRYGAGGVRNVPGSPLPRSPSRQVQPLGAPLRAARARARRSARNGKNAEVDHRVLLGRTPRKAVARAARFLGHAEPSGDQSRRPRRKMRGRGGRPAGRLPHQKPPVRLRQAALPSLVFPAAWPVIDPAVGKARTTDQSTVAGSRDHPWRPRALEISASVAFSVSLTATPPIPENRPRLLPRQHVG